MGLGAQMGRGLDTLFAKCGEVAFPESKQHEKVSVEPWRSHFLCDCEFNALGNQEAKPRHTEGELFYLRGRGVRVFIH